MKSKIFYWIATGLCMMVGIGRLIGEDTTELIFAILMGIFVLLFSFWHKENH